MDVSHDTVRTALRSLVVEMNSSSNAIAIMYSRVIVASLTATKEIRSLSICGQHKGIKRNHVSCAPT